MTSGASCDRRFSRTLGDFDCQIETRAPDGMFLSKSKPQLQSQAALESHRTIVNHDLSSFLFVAFGNLLVSERIAALRFQH